MRAIFLGTADGHTSARREHSGILLQTRETSLLLDCGAAAARFLLAKKIEPDVPEILWISHMHSDHNGQVASLIQSLWLRTRRAPLHVFGPAEVMSAMKDWLEKCLLFPELIGFPIHWHAVKPGRPWVHGPFTLTAFATQHLVSLAGHFKRAYPKTCFDCYGLLIQYERTPLRLFRRSGPSRRTRSRPEGWKSRRPALRIDPFSGTGALPRSGQILRTVGLDNPLSRSLWYAGKPKSNSSRGKKNFAARYI